MSKNLFFGNADKDFSRRMCNRRCDLNITLSFTFSGRKLLLFFALSSISKHFPIRVWLLSVKRKLRGNYCSFSIHPVFRVNVDKGRGLTIFSHFEVTWTLVHVNVSLQYFFTLNDNLNRRREIVGWDLTLELNDCLPKKWLLHWNVR